MIPKVVTALGNFYVRFDCLGTFSPHYLVKADYSFKSF